MKKRTELQRRAPARVAMQLKRSAGIRKRRGKYGVAAKEDRTRFGVLYDSKLEMNYAAKLELLKHALNQSDVVIEVKRQVSFPLEVNGNLICVYRADFVVIYGDGRAEVHEVKGLATPDWKIKEKLFRALYPNVTLKVIKRV